MREIKFRIYDRVQKVMWQHENLASLDFESKCAWIKQRIKGGHWVYFKNAEMLEYTGVKDDAGKEIYEGDIVRVSCALIPPQNIDLDGEVKMLEGGWVIDSGSELRNLWSEVHNVQIIGNIYEGLRK